MATGSSSETGSTPSSPTIAIVYGTAESKNDLQGILDLQSVNVPTALSETELSKEGFVTFKHTIELLTAMNVPYPHVICKDDNDRVMGYLLVMQRSFMDHIPASIEMCEQVNKTVFRGELLGNSSYFLTGQVCIQKGYRGQGIFQGLFNKMKEGMSRHFTYMISAVSERNPRSLKAHYKVGFQDVLRFKASSGEDWVMILWDWN